MSDIRDSTAQSESPTPSRDDSDGYPELIFGIAGAIGVEVASICDSLSNALRSVRYESHIVHLTREMAAYPISNEVPEPRDRNFFTDVMYKIHFANALCEELKDASTLARIGLRAICARRERLTGDQERPRAATAYIIRQLKRPAEVALLRRVYGKRFVLISAYGS